jgi:hypothetical protein
MTFEEKISNLRADLITKYTREELEKKYAMFLLDWAETDTYVREKCKDVLTDFEINGDSYGVPTVEEIVDKLVEKIKNGNQN